MLLDFNDIDQLKSAGFRGFLTKSELFTDSSMIPDQQGVYLVLSLDSSLPTYLETGTGGFFKQKNPNVSSAELKANWVEGAMIVYIGKATSLKKRLRQYFAFGQGKNVGHWGGGYIWQLAHSKSLVVCWKTLPIDNPATIEAVLIKAFTEKHGKRPFANLKG